jgi:pyruvate formate lyase activating enzyme
MATLVTNIQGYSIHDGPGIRTTVFLKGCGLECQWCSNPECIAAQPEVGLINSLCTRCGQCAGVCPQKALLFEAGQLPQIARERCSGCGICSTVCPSKAIVVYGNPTTVEAVFEAVRRDKMFYETSGGGITISGGEVLLQPQFAAAVLELCRRNSIGTCIETSGGGSEAALRQLLPWLDLILFDLKHLNSEAHRRLTGQPNEIILANARIAAASGVAVLFRMPLIPGLNDSRSNIEETAAFIKDLNLKPSRIELMPYHRLGKGKYESLGKPFRLPDLAAPTKEYGESVKQQFEDLGVGCSISS